MNQLISFEPGKQYFCRSACNYDSVWAYEVVSRTDKSVRIRDLDDDHKITTRRIRVWQGVETCLPHGSYSMAPSLAADRQVQPA